MRKISGEHQQPYLPALFAALFDKTAVGKGLARSGKAMLVVVLTLLIGLFCQTAQAQTACSTGGQIVYASGSQSMAWCNGSSLVAVGGANNGTCTASDAGVFRLNTGMVEWCNGTNWKRPTTSATSLGPCSTTGLISYISSSVAVCDGTKFVVWQHSVAAYAANFTGSSYFTFSTNPLPTPGTGNWTVEFWINRNGMTDTSNERVMLDSTDKFAIDFYTNNSFAVWGGSTYYLSSTIGSTGWNHVAVVRNGTTTTTFLNGVAAGSASMGFSVPSTVMYLGGPGYLKAQLANFHISNVARYTGTFTPTKSNTPDANSVAFFSFNNTTANTAPGSSITLTPTGTTPFVQNFN